MLRADEERIGPVDVEIALADHIVKAGEAKAALGEMREDIGEKGLLLVERAEEHLAENRVDAAAGEEVFATLEDAQVEALHVGFQKIDPGEVVARAEVVERIDVDVATGCPPCRS